MDELVFVHRFELVPKSYDSLREDLDIDIVTNEYDELS
jgi:hypothetical protein